MSMILAGTTGKREIFAPSPSLPCKRGRESCAARQSEGASADQLLGTPAFRIEVLAQAAPDLDVIVLSGRVFRRKTGDPLREAGFEHERERAFELHGRELRGARVVERGGVGAVRQHAIVQADAARQKAF